ncbi:hypothetical protein HYT59_02130, partial [Candidatus Woesebacteria bacterium]|nr:hypothetical protein [Candidatus Woesebacteria bacterium]
MAKRFFVLSLLISLYLSIPVSSVLGYYTNMSADVVIGQPDFTSNTGGTSQSQFTTVNIRQVVVDPMGRMIVADQGNNRILVWNSVPTTNGKPADLVLGQPDFNSGTANNGGLSARTMNVPASVYSDGNRLFVADDSNDRVLIWNTFPTSNGQAADVVVGESNFTSTDAGTCNSSNLARPNGLWVYQNKLVVSDRSQDRILIWNSIPTANGVPADLVLGQTGFTTCSAQTISASTFIDNRGVLVDQNGKLYVADRGNRRILIWNTFPTSNGQAADVVVGQGDFTTSATNANADRIGQVLRFYVSNNRLFVSAFNSVRIFNSIPTSNGASADIVLGQTNFTDSSANSGGSTSASGFNVPAGIFEYNNKLLVTDEGNARILIFTNIISNPAIGLYPFPEAVGNGRLRMRGNVRLGQWDRYSLTRSKLTVSINGGGEGMVDSLYGNREDTHDNLYEFFHEFDPSPIPGGTEGYT